MRDSPTMRADIEPPWYRQFWPWFIIALPAATVLGSMVTIFLAVTRPDSLVVDDYSRIGELTEQRFRRGAAALAMGLSGRLVIVAGDGSVELRLESNAAGAPMTEWPDTLLLELAHPTLQERDMDIVLTRAPMAGDGVFRARLAPMSAERWYVSAEPLGETPIRWRLTGEVSPLDGSGRLVPAGGHDGG